MSGKIYLLEDNGTLQSLNERPYDNEDLLQTLLENYPDLLAGDQMDESAPRRWLLVSREVGVPDEAEGSGRWSMDHLFLDQDAIPTLVEVKRSSDTRIRREVVAQMLDYAANSVVYLDPAIIYAKFEAACENREEDPMQLVTSLLEADTDGELAVENFWSQIKTNLRAGKIRMVFVADEIPPELRRIVEFLNEQMDPAEVLAVEIRQYVGEGLKTLVPKVIGQTSEAQRKRSPVSRGGRQWDEQSFFKELEARCSVEEAEVAKEILRWSKENTDLISWGKGKQDAALTPKLTHKGEQHWIINVWTYGKVDIPFGWIQKSSPFNNESKRLDLLHRLNQIPGVDIPKDRIDKFPSFPLSALRDEKAFKQFLETLDWIVHEIRSE